MNYFYYYLVINQIYIFFLPLNDNLTIFIFEYYHYLLYYLLYDIVNVNFNFVS